MSTFQIRYAWYASVSGFLLCPPFKLGTLGTLAYRNLYYVHLSKLGTLGTLAYCKFILCPPFEIRYACTLAYRDLYYVHLSN